MKKNNNTFLKKPPTTKNLHNLYCAMANFIHCNVYHNILLILCTSTCKLICALQITLTKCINRLI